jgi:tetraacyldisaccharide 4'-kinase
MREPAFWWRSPGLAAALLTPLSAGYGAIAAARSFRRTGRKAEMPVLCIGNLTLGGTGKTPCALAVARLLIGAGARPFFLTRGYGGAHPGPVRVDAARHRAVDVGDEALLLARLAPTIVARDRVAGASLAVGANVIVMDDGFQNPSLVKDRSIVVVDGRRGIGNGRVFPAGPLRAPLAVQLEHAHALLVVGAPSAACGAIAAARVSGIPLFQGRLVPGQAAVAALAGRRVLAFAGIGDPEKFFATLAAAGIDAPVRESFPDHHRYARAEAAALLARADREGLDLVTTEKDLVRLSGDSDMAELAARAQALPVTLVLDEETAFRQWLLAGLATKAGPPLAI